jgi:LacI family transcriptional regulator
MGDIVIIDRNSPIPQYFQLQTWLIEQIEQGIFKPNDKIPTEAEINQVTGLARATIRQAVQNLVNMGYLERKKRLGTFVLDSKLDIDKKTIIGMIIPDIRSGYAPELARGAEDEAAQNKHSLILCNTDDLFTSAEIHANRLIDHHVSGVIFVPTAASDEKNRQIIKKFLRKNIPVVLADRTIPDLKIDFITTDNFEGAYTLTEYLIHKGHKRIAITLSTLFSTERERLRGYKQALTDNDIPVDESIILTDNSPFIEMRYHSYAKKILVNKNNITAAFAGHDRIALQFYLAANELNIKIPDHISLVGYDDLHFTTISLTTMHQPIYEMGMESMKLILARIRGEKKEQQKIELNSYLVERSSVKQVGT